MLKCLFLSDEGLSLETLNHAFRISACSIYANILYLYFDFNIAYRRRLRDVHLNTPFAWDTKSPSYRRRTLFRLPLFLILAFSLSARMFLRPVTVFVEQTLFHLLQARRIVL